MSKSPDAFRTISEVADWLGVQAHVLRFWESKFTQVKPVKRAGGRRYYRPADMQLLGGIKKLLHDDGMSIKEVQALLREHGVAHVAEFSHSLDATAEDRAAAAPPADKLGDDWQSSLDLSHEQAAQDEAGSGLGPSNVVGFPQQTAGGAVPDAAASGTSQETAAAPGEMSPAAPENAPDTVSEPAPAEPEGPEAAQEPQMRMDLTHPADEAETEEAAEPELGQPGSGTVSADEAAADDTAPAAAEDYPAAVTETGAASPWNDTSAEDAPEDAPSAEAAGKEAGEAAAEPPAAPQAPAAAEHPEQLEMPAAAADEAPQDAAPLVSEDAQAAEAVTAPDHEAAPTDMVDPLQGDMVVSHAESEAGQEQVLPEDPASAAETPSAQSAPAGLTGRASSRAAPQAPLLDSPVEPPAEDVAEMPEEASAGADTLQPGEAGPQAEPERLDSPDHTEHSGEGIALEPAADPEPVAAYGPEEEYQTAAGAGQAEDMPPLAAVEAEPAPAEDTLVAAAGLQPDMPLEFGSGAEPAAASLPVSGSGEDADTEADPAAAFPPHDLDEAARQVDAMEFASGFDPDADVSPEAETPQDSLAAEQLPTPESAETPLPEMAEPPAPEAAEPAAPQAAEPPLQEAADPSPAPAAPHHAVLAHLAAIRSLPPQTLEEIAACAEKLRALSAREAVSGARESSQEIT